MKGKECTCVKHATKFLKVYLLMMKIMFVAKCQTISQEGPRLPPLFHPLHVKQGIDRSKRSMEFSDPTFKHDKLQDDQRWFLTIKNLAKENK